MNIQQWEYKWIEFYTSKEDDLLFNKYGKDGWELVGYYRFLLFFGQAIFKRPIQPKSDDKSPAIQSESL